MVESNTFILKVPQLILVIVLHFRKLEADGYRDKSAAFDFVLNEKYHIPVLFLKLTK